MERRNREAFHLQNLWGPSLSSYCEDYKRSFICKQSAYVNHHFRVRHSPN